MSSGNAGLVDLLVSLPDEGEHLSSNVSFQASDDLELGMALCDAPGPVGLGFLIRAKSADGDDVQRAVGSAVAAAVESMPGRLTGRSRHGTDTTERGKAGFGPQPFRIVSSGQKKLCRAGMTNRISSQDWAPAHRRSHRSWHPGRRFRRAV